MNMEAHRHRFGRTDAPENYDNNLSVSWKGGFFSQPSSSDHDFSYYQHDFSTQLPHDMMSSPSVFPCEGNNVRPSHGLSLSLNSSAIGQTEDYYIRFGTPGSRSVDNTHYHGLIKGCRYMGPAQELLSEFCDLGPGQRGSDKMKGVEKNCDGRWQRLHSLDLPLLQRRKMKLLQLLEEVDRRYKHYCNQMKSVVYSFESVAGDGAATAYSGLASKVMSRHFRCLRDGISSQIKATSEAMGEKAGCAFGTGKGETPRLRVVDQTLRQQRALQQMVSMETHPWRPQRGLPERSVSALRAWLFEHFLHPYPSDVDKHILARQTGLSRSQVSNWFINARVRLWKPMVEEMYLEELKEEGPDHNDDAFESVEPSPNSDHKPTHGQIVRIESECLSSIINSGRRNNGTRNKGQNPVLGDIGDHSFATASMEYDFSSYGVSLTLGLHQHGMNLPFSLAEGQGVPLFYPRDVDDDRDMIG